MNMVGGGMLDEGTPLFVQIAAQVADDIADGSLAEGGRAPSTNELAAFHRINPATAAKGLALLLDDGLLEKRRGLGMFVVAGAREKLLGRRRGEFVQQYLAPMLTEARRLGIDHNALVDLIRETDAGNSSASQSSSRNTRSDDTDLRAIGGSR
jgi:DNA-binding transcriptional regulator YhcF (GntR family)